MVREVPKGVSTTLDARMQVTGALIGADIKEALFDDAVAQVAKAKGLTKPVPIRTGHILIPQKNTDANGLRTMDITPKVSYVIPTIMSNMDARIVVYEYVGTDLKPVFDGGTNVPNYTPVVLTPDKKYKLEITGTASSPVWLTLSGVIVGDYRTDLDHYTIENDTGA
jgi:hypothetical protein